MMELKEDSSFEQILFFEGKEFETMKDKRHLKISNSNSILTTVIQNDLRRNMEVDRMYRFL